MPPRPTTSQPTRPTVVPGRALELRPVDEQLEDAKKRYTATEVGDGDFDKIREEAAERIASTIPEDLGHQLLAKLDEVLTRQATIESQMMKLARRIEDDPRHDGYQEPVVEDAKEEAVEDHSPTAS